jgi:two-component system sensor histidine kinase KdpD
MERVWITLSGPDASERVAADTGPGPPPVQALVSVLHRMPGDEPARWIRVRPPTPRSRRGSGREAFRVRIDVGPTSLGSIWALRARHREPPDRTATRLLAAAADQLGQALAQDRLRAEAEAAEIARRSDELKSALLQSVSHDLRTPLATIRAAAGSLQPGSGLGAADRQASAEAIDREVDYLNRLVTNLLDLSRIEAGALRAERDPFELDDVVGATLERLAPRLAGRSLEIDLGAPAVLADPVFVDAVVTNLVDNALKHTPPGTRIRVGASQTHPETVRLTVEDAGGGVPGEAFPRLFDKFYRVPGTATGSRAGTGIGLAVVFGLVEAMAGRVEARPSELGGLAIDVDLPAAEPSPVASPAGRVR